MRAFGVLLLSSLWLPAQPAPQSAPHAAVVRGTLLERDAQTVSGEFSIHAADSQVFRYRFDVNTRVERDAQPVDVARLQPGESVEVLSDEAPQSNLRYARSVQVLSDPALSRLSAPVRVRPLRPPLDRVVFDRAIPDRIFPAGNLAYSGVVFRLNRERVMLHTREAGDQTILLRQDTRYLQNGTVVEPDELKPNMRVFVRAGKTLYNEIEAYQVVWGQILMPH